MAIIGILAAVGTVGYSNYMETTKIKVLKSNAEAVASAFKTFSQAGHTGQGCKTWQECYDYVENQIWRNPYNSSNIHTVFFGMYCGTAGPNASIKQRGSIIVDRYGSEVNVGYCDANDTHQLVSSFIFD